MQRTKRDFIEQEKRNVSELVQLRVKYSEVVKESDKMKVELTKVYSKMERMKIQTAGPYLAELKVKNNLLE